MSGPSPQMAETEEKYHRSYLGLQTMNPNCCWDRELPRADCVVCHSKKKSLDVVLKKHRIMGLSVIPYIFSVLPRNTTPNVKTICTLSVTAGVCINRCLKAYIYEFSTVQSSHKLSRTRGRSRPSWWHWLIPLLRVPFSCLVLIECNSLLAPLHQIRQWSLRWPAGAQRWG